MEGVQIVPLGAALQLCCQRQTLRIVDIDDCRTQAGPGKQLALGLPVSLHGAVIVQMILREIGKHGGMQLHPCQAMFGNADG